MLDIQAAPATPTAYLFGGFRLEVAHRFLYRGADVVPLPEQIFQMLLLLVEANGSVVSRETIALRVWPETAVANGNIAQHVYLLRQILGERARDRGLVMSVSRRGYRLTVPVTVVAGGGARGASPSDSSPGGIDSEDFGNYCEGSYLLERRTARVLRRAIDLFESSVRRAPNQVPTLVGLYVPSFNLAIVAVAVGRLDDAWAHFVHAHEQREPALLFLRSLRWLAAIEDRKGFQEIARSIAPPS